MTNEPANKVVEYDLAKIVIRVS